MIIRFSITESLRVKGAFIGPLVLIGMLYLIELGFWSATTTAGDIGGYDHHAITNYVLWSVLIFQLTTVTGLPDDISEHIEKGSIDRFLILPKNFVLLIVEYGIGQLISRLILFSPVIGAVIFYQGFNQSLLILPLFILLGAVVNLLFTFSISCLTFKFRDAYAFIVFKDTLAWMLSGALIPLDLFPATLQSLFTYLPFQYIAYVPTQIALGNIDITLIHGLPLVLLSLCLVATMMWNHFSTKNQGYSSNE